jgi:methionine-S-sulfoxide reductase
MSYYSLLLFKRHTCARADRGSQYKTAIFYHTEEQQALAQQSKADLNESSKFSDPVVTKILKVKTFYPAEEYHQDYYKKHATSYNNYKELSGRSDFLKENWK